MCKIKTGLHQMNPQQIQELAVARECGPRRKRNERRRRRQIEAAKVANYFQKILARVAQASRAFQLGDQGGVIAQVFDLDRRVIAEPVHGDDGHDLRFS